MISCCLCKILISIGNDFGTFDFTTLKECVENVYINETKCWDKYCWEIKVNRARFVLCIFQ